MEKLIKTSLHELILKKNFTEVYRHLWDTYYPTLLSFAESHLKSTELAEEVVSDILFQIWNKKEDIGKIEHMRIYLFTSVRNRCYRELSKRKKEQDVLRFTEEPIEALSTEVAIDPESTMLTGELAKIIAEVVENLPPRCQLIYKLIREQGYRNKDVAVQLGISINTIDVQLAIAVKKISFAISLYGQ
ncbi:RNA polymerase sigma-70 factor [Hufsiella ginkgonis]|uniref:RNA polymerase sigma-70 factor n=1 Tax=Hufsiella ginkgonis TaxID=2695274 RepID=A0A7K1XRZ8_9SPHI|nr:RNA polymerase sigma-70 factor [Hufsiella ginkgonis]MXV13771.1 RNA polymerase sigma-70 factor [Hufsiella ginkgonis]